MSAAKITFCRCCWKKVEDDHTLDNCPDKDPLHQLMSKLSPSEAAYALRTILDAHPAVETTYRNFCKKAPSIKKESDEKKAAAACAKAEAKPEGDGHATSHDAVPAKEQAVGVKYAAKKDKAENERHGAIEKSNNATKKRFKDTKKLRHRERKRREEEEAKKVQQEIDEYNKGQLQKQKEAAEEARRNDPLRDPSGIHSVSSEYPFPLLNGIRKQQEGSKKEGSKKEGSKKEGSKKEGSKKEGSKKEAFFIGKNIWSADVFLMPGGGDDRPLVLSKTSYFCMQNLLHQLIKSIELAEFA
ncbi:hypothetical protein V8F20_008325 [Naviculisporaceae sp. PSN 640]